MYLLQYIQLPNSSDAVRGFLVPEKTENACGIMEVHCVVLLVLVVLFCVRVQF